MKIVHIGSKGLPAQGGTERVVQALALRHARFHQVTVYGSRAVCGRGEVAGARVIGLRVPASKHIGPAALDVLATIDVLTWLRAPDVVVVHGSENAFVVPFLRLRSAVVTTNHGPAYARAKWSPVARALIRAVERVSVRCPDVATAVAAPQAEALEHRYGRPVTYIPNGVDGLEDVDRSGARKLLAEHGLAPGGYWLFAAARVDPTKGCGSLLTAYREVPGAPPLLVVGDLWHAPGHEEQLRALSAGLPVTFVPRTSSKPLLLGLLKDAGLFVFPSTVEAMSMMLLEALAIGVPTIASDIPENTSILPPGIATFRAGDTADLRARLLQFQKADASAASATAQAAADWVRGTYDWDAIAASYEEAYAQAMAARRARRAASPQDVERQMGGRHASVSQGKRQRSEPSSRQRPRG